jgi:hypothetical protein
LLLHERLEGQITDEEMHDLVMDLQATGLRDIRIAIADDNSADAEINALGQLLANNRGGNVKLFSSLPEAETWILAAD